MTLSQAKNLHANGYIHHVTKTNADGTPIRAKVTSVKTWKTRPNEVEIRVKRGMYEYATFSEIDLDQIEIGYGS